METAEICGLTLNTEWALLQEINKQVATLSTEGSTVKIDIKFWSPGHSSINTYLIEKTFTLRGGVVEATVFNADVCIVTLTAEDGRGCVIVNIPMTAMQVMSILACDAERCTENDRTREKLVKQLEWIAKVWNTGEGTGA